MSKRMIRIGVLDSQPVIHAGIRHLLAAFPDLAVVADAYDVAGLLHSVRHARPDIVLVECVDLDRPIGDLLCCLQDIAPGLRFVVFTGTADLTDVREALRNGVDGYLLKRVAALTLATALRSIAAGQQVLAPEATQTLILADEPGTMRADSLTHREREVLTLLMRGLSNRQIAEQLFVSVSTVKFHLAAIAHKLGVTGRAQVIVCAYNLNLVPRPVKTGEHHPLTKRRSCAS